MDTENIFSHDNKISPARYAQQLEALREVGRILASGLHLKQAFSKVLDLMDKKLELNKGTISLLVPDDNRLSIESAHGLSEEKSQRITYRLGEGVTGKVVQTGKTMIVPRVSIEPLFLNRFERSNITEQELSFICTPIVVGNDVIGTLSVDKEFNETDLLEDDARVLKIVSSMIAIVFKAHRDAAIERQLFEDERQQLYKQLEEQKQFEKTESYGSLKERTQLLERKIIINSLEKNNGNITAVARDLKTTSRIIRYKAKELSIDPMFYNQKKKLPGSKATLIYH